MMLLLSDSGNDAVAPMVARLLFLTTYFRRLLPGSVVHDSTELAIKSLSGEAFRAHAKPGPLRVAYSSIIRRIRSPPDALLSMTRNPPEP